MTTTGRINLPIVETNFRDTNIIVNSYATALTMEIKFVNLSKEYLVVCFRDGSYSILPPEIDDHNINSLIIGHNKRSKRTDIKILSGNECEITNKLRAIVNSSSNKFLYWEEGISLDTIKKYKNGLYSAAADVVIGMVDRIGEMAGHPFSRQHIHNMYLNLLEDFSSQHDFNVNLRYIDNEISTGKLYAVFHNKIVVLQPRQSNVMKTGVYITGLVNAVSANYNEIRKDEYYSLQEIYADKCPVKMFKTLIEAQELLDAVHLSGIQEKAKDRDHEAFIAEIKMAKEKLENENRLLQAQISKNKFQQDEIDAIRVAQAEANRQKAEENLYRQKEEYGQRSSDTKFWTETIKMIGITLGVALTIYKLIPK